MCCWACRVFRRIQSRSLHRAQLHNLSLSVAFFRASRLINTIPNDLGKHSFTPNSKDIDVYYFIDTATRRAMMHAKLIHIMTQKAQLKNMQIANCTNMEPLYVPLPKVGHYCPISGLTRSVLNSLILPMPINGYKPLVRSISLKRPGWKRGKRLVDFKSLVSYLASF